MLKEVLKATHMYHIQYASKGKGHQTRKIS